MAVPGGRVPRGDMTRKPALIAAAAATAAVVTVVVGVVWFLARSAPVGVDLDAAAEGLAAAGPPATLDGEWRVRPDGVARDGEDSFVGYRIQERLSGVGQNTAVGRTGDVTATLVIDGNTLTAAEVQVDLRGLRSDDSRRDGQVGRALDVTRLPTASFLLADPVPLGEAAASGEPFSLTVVGDLTIRGLTHRVEVSLQALVREDAAAVIGEVPLVLADYGVQVPRVPIVVSADDHGIVEWQLFFVRS
jgi:polyisoprenoid-binding protein YceI